MAKKATDLEERVRLANRELLGKGKLELVDEFFTPDYVARIGSRRGNGPRFVVRFVRAVRTAFPDLRVVRVTPLLVKGDTIAWQRTLSGTHAAKLSGMPASGRKLRWCDILVSRFERGRIAEEWAVSELAEKLLAAPPRS
ncbi:MAG: ester cyclase [Planctomycetes bacterium]|nr:ester cyclase [Planctomycetota bacterium]MCB9904999.1 ester cyclase [Planctomycetota bacterium]